MIMMASRADLIEKAGKKMPTTFAELVDVCDAIHGQERMAAFTADKLHHWNFIPYLMGHGGGVFKDPPGNLTPTWDTPEAATAAEYYATLLTKYGPPGILSFTDSQSMQTQKNGRANIRTQLNLDTECAWPEHVKDVKVDSIAFTSKRFNLFLPITASGLVAWGLGFCCGDDGGGT